MKMDTRASFLRVKADGGDQPPLSGPEVKKLATLLYIISMCIIDRFFAIWGER